MGFRDWSPTANTMIGLLGSYQRLRSLEIQLHPLRMLARPYIYNFTRRTQSAFPESPRNGDEIYEDPMKPIKPGPPPEIAAVEMLFEFKDPSLDPCGIVHLIETHEPEFARLTDLKLAPRIDKDQYHAKKGLI